MYLHVVETQCLAMTRYAGLSLLSSIHVLITVGVVKMLEAGAASLHDSPGVKQWENILGICRDAAATGH